MVLSKTHKDRFFIINYFQKLNMPVKVRLNDNLRIDKSIFEDFIN